jgi:glycosyltransferase involved in cell wall biosynthesis
MRITYCIPTLGGGGAERELSYLAAEMSRMGHEVHVVSSRGGENLGRLEAGGAAWHEVGGGSNYDSRIFFRLVGLIRKLRPHVLQTCLTQMDILGGAAALLTRTRWVLRESSSAAFYGAGLKNGLRVALARRADAVVSNSAGGEAYWRSAGGVRRLLVIPNGIPFDEIDRAGDGEATGLGPGRDEKVVLFAGRMDAGKNVENLIAALARIADEVAFVAVLCGDGPLRPSLERLAAESGVGQRVLFPGHVSNLWSLMKRAGALASLSRFEGRPNVVTEAMACGCPLVVSDIPAHREILDERSARLVNPDDPSQIAEALKETLTRGDAALARAREARARAAQWTIEAMARRYERLYLGLCGEGRDT